MKRKITKMITTPITSNANQAGKYYYETEEHNAEWGGKLTEFFELGGVTKIPWLINTVAVLQKGEEGYNNHCSQEQFQAMLLGYSPEDLKTALFKNTGNPLRRAGADYTFTMAKNSSILAMLDPRILDAFKESVIETLDIAEERYAETRTRISSEKRIIEKTGNMLYTLFLHYASRNGDPGIHFHTFIHNITKDKNGILKSFEYKDLYANKAYLGAIQENIYAQKLQTLGYTIDSDRSKAMVDIKIDDKELEKLKERFSTRQAEIDNKVEELRKKYPTMTEKDLRQLAEKATRQRKEHNPTYEETKKFVETKLSDEELKKLNNIVESAKNNIAQAQQKETEFEKFKNTKAALKQGLKDITENYRTFKYEKAENVTIKHNFGKTNVQAVASAIKLNKDIIEIKIIQKEEEAESKKKIKVEKDFFEDKTTAYSTKYFTTKEVLRDIKQNYDTILQNAESEAFYEKKEIDKEIKIWQTKNGKTLTQSQASMAHTVLSSRYKFNIVQGDAGTGKTNALNLINKFLEQKGYKIVGASHTGKATEVLKDSNIKNIYTISKLQNLVENGKITFDEKTILFLDESSMISDKQAKFLNSLGTAKIVYIGDEKQFKSIERGDFFKEAYEAAKSSGLSVYTNMDIPVRYHNKTQEDIALTLARKNFKGAFEKIESAGNIISFKENETNNLEALTAKFNAIKEEYFKDISKNTLILVDTNLERNALNSLIVEGLKEKELIGKNGQNFKVYENKVVSVENAGFAESYNPGEKIIIDKTYQMYTIKDIDKDKNILKLQAEDGEEKSFNLTNKNKDNIHVYIEKDIEVAENDKIVFLKNDKNLNVSNGELATVKLIDEAGNITAVKDNNDVVIFKQEDYKNFDLGYALTSYKSQGETVNKTLYSLNNDGGYSKNFEEKFYVVGTRSTDEIKIFGTEAEVEKFKENIKFAEETEDFKNKLSVSVKNLAFALTEEDVAKIDKEEQIEQAVEQEQEQEQNQEIEHEQQEQRQEQEQQQLH